MGTRGGAAKPRSAATKRAKHLPLAASGATRRRVEGRQVLRQLRLVHALERARRGLGLSELMDIAGDGCTERTLYRDLDQLQQLPLPLTSQDGRWRLTGPGLAALPVSASDLVALEAAERLLLPLARTWLADDLATLRGKIAALLTPEGRAFAQEQSHTVALGFTAPAPLDGKQHVVSTLHDAIGRQHRTRIRHASPGNAARDRIVEPLGLWYAGGSTYLVARCTESGEPRKFLTLRIEDAQELDEAFEPDPSFDFEAYTRSAFDVHHGPVLEIVLAASPAVAHLFVERRFHASQSVARTEDGGAKVTLRTGGIEAVARWLAGFGGDVRVVDPDELREAVRGVHARGLVAVRSRVRRRSDVE